MAAVARSQHGPFTRAQAISAGFTPATIKRQVALGRWDRVHRSVLCDTTVPQSFERDASAAVLACGPAAAACHTTAGRIWGADVPLAARPEATVLLPSRVRPPGVIVHETTRLTRSEAAPRDGIRVTSPARTLLDLAGSTDSKVLELALDGMWRRRLVDPRRLLIYLEDEWCVARRGTAVLRRLVSERVGEGAPGSDLETRLLQLIRDARLPMPIRQYPVVTPFGPRYLDLAYPRERIAIELDGMESRLDPAVFLDERVRQNLVEAQGWTFRRFGHAHVHEHRLWTIFTLAEALGLFPSRWLRARRSGRLGRG